MAFNKGNLCRLSLYKEMIPVKCKLGIYVFIQNKNRTPKSRFYPPPKFSPQSGLISSPKMGIMYVPELQIFKIEIQRNLYKEIAYTNERNSCEM